MVTVAIGVAHTVQRFRACRYADRILIPKAPELRKGYPIRNPDS